MKQEEKDPDVSQRARLAHEIQNFFRYKHKEAWVSEKELKNHSRLHNQVFNELIRRGFIEKKRTIFGYKYKWKTAMPKID